MHLNPGSMDGRWEAASHMPRWASRLALEITAVRVERVQEISEADAIAEGIEHVDNTKEVFGYRDYEGSTGCTFEPWKSFCTLWDSLNAKRGFGWDVNPWVWVREFKVVG
jgi:hypothetical protein